MRGDSSSAFSRKLDASGLDHPQASNAVAAVASQDPGARRMDSAATDVQRAVVPGSGAARGAATAVRETAPTRAGDALGSAGARGAGRAGGSTGAGRGGHAGRPRAATQGARGRRALASPTDALLPLRTDPAVPAAAHAVGTAIGANRVAGKAARAGGPAAGHRRRRALAVAVAASARAGRRAADAAAGMTFLSIRARAAAAAAAVAGARAVVGEHRRAAEAAAARSAAIVDGRLLAGAIGGAASTRAGRSVAEAQPVDALLAWQTGRPHSAAAASVRTASIGGQGEARTAAHPAQAAIAGAAVGTARSGRGDHAAGTQTTAERTGAERASAADAGVASLVGGAGLTGQSLPAAFAVAVAQPATQAIRRAASRAGRRIADARAVDASGSKIACRC